MLREAGLSEIKKKRIPKSQCVFVARKRGNDELTPSDDLFSDFGGLKKSLEKDMGKGSAEAHNRAFIDCVYENRFRKQIVENLEAMISLEKIGKRSINEDIYLVCYEGKGKACHRRILLRIAEEHFGVKVIVEGVEPK
jgi:hypothetical protein